MKVFLAIVLALSLTACATNPESVRAVAEANKVMMQTPTLSFDCPGGCKVSYTDPRDRTQMATPTNGWDVMKSVVNNFTSIAPSLVTTGAMGMIAVEGFKAMKGHGQSTSTVNTNTETTTANVTNSNNTTDDHTATTTTTTTTTTNPVSTPVP